ncbi:cyclase family protein [Desulfallas thermosapovorans]|uniref:Kynurenine formamidase n=1 Tax=Desulfallas thermosapovorans DSM 6562 TaxID=1121431 RepID=A0A5S4ZY80_9FIRM|nr:cyclase family protein [Desulfallas thermosapovorans]TYO97224.1 Kynurenine formamidase [Desulfallas thermosapovorans DSM 6562]
MQFIDLTHTIAPGMPVYPGTEPPRITGACSIAKDGFREKTLFMYSHTGTHIDAPAHILEDGATLDSLPAAHFYGRATVLDVSRLPGPEITRELISLPPRVNIDFVIFYTGWYHKWGTPAFYTGFPVPSPQAANYLAGLGIKGVGTDAISIDRAGTTNFIIHKIFLQKNMIIIENLANLAGLAGKIFTLCCFPLKIADADGAPVRAVAICDNGEHRASN